MNKSAPKPSHTTPEQDRLLNLAETRHARARIYRLGVAIFLREQFQATNEIQEAAMILLDSVSISKEAYRISEEAYRMSAEASTQAKPSGKGGVLKNNGNPCKPSVERQR